MSKTKLNTAQETARQQKDELLDRCQLISRARLLELLDVTYPTLWNWVRAGHFPPPRTLSGNEKRGKLAWVESEVQEWIASRPVRLPKGSTMTEAA
jgi:predicted DNA-binding transcriptional regulator AlpA